MTIPTREEITALLHTNSPLGNRAVERALLVLLSNQTEDERRDETTKHTNDKGFTSADAKKMTSMARQVERSPYPKGQKLSSKQLGWLRRPNKGGTSRIAKYGRQLIEAAEKKASAAPS